MDAVNTLITPLELLSLRNTVPAPLVIDVRREPAYLAAPDVIAGAMRRDPAKVADWTSDLPKTTRIVVYCVHGHEVSQNAAKSLRDSGLQAQFLEGGIEAWRASGGELAVKQPVAPGKTP